MQIPPLPLLLLLLPQTQAQSTNVAIYTASKTYTYHGCYNETTEIDGSDHSRALSGGANAVRGGEMTVPMCLDFCARGDGNNGTGYLYAGLEWSRECWCAKRISDLAQKLDDQACDFPCEGNKSLACGAALKLSVYQRSEAARALKGTSAIGLLVWVLAVVGVAR